MLETTNFAVLHPLQQKKLEEFYGKYDDLYSKFCCV